MQSEMPLAFGAKLKELRTSHNMTLKQLADALGTSKAYIWQVENNSNPNPSASLVLGAAKVFNVSPYDLFQVGDHSEGGENLDTSIISDYFKLKKRDQMIIANLVSSLRAETAAA